MTYKPGDVVRLAFNKSVEMTIVSNKNGILRCKLGDFYNSERCEDFGELELEPVLKNKKQKNIFYNP